MTLSKADIETELNSELEITREQGELAIEPSSIDLHLGNELKVPLKQKRDVKVGLQATYPTFETHKLPFTIPSKGFALAHTQEVVNIPDYLVGNIDGRSSVGRLGLFVENAGLVDANFTGDLTLELFNAAPYPITLEEDMRIAQLTLNKHESAPTIAYSEENNNKYQHQRGPTPSKLYEDF